MDTRGNYEAAKTRCGMTDYKVAKAANVPLSTLYAWVERMEGNPHAAMRLSAMIRVAQALGITLGELIGTAG